MNYGSRKKRKRWLDYCMDSKVLDRKGMAELRMTKDVKGYNPAMYVIVMFHTGGGIEEILSEDTYGRARLLRIWESW